MGNLLLVKWQTVCVANNYYQVFAFTFSSAIAVKFGVVLCLSVFMWNWKLSFSLSLFSLIFAMSNIFIVVMIISKQCTHVANQRNSNYYYFR